MEAFIQWRAVFPHRPPEVGGERMLQPKILNVEPMGSDKLRLYYENGEIRLFDVRPYMSGEWYASLRMKTILPR